MFHPAASETGVSYRLFVMGLSLLSLSALGVTLWVMSDFLKEQQTLDTLVQQLPPDAKGSAETLIGELRWQFRWSILVVLNLVVTSIAILLLLRAYKASQASLRDVRAIASEVLSCMEQGVVTTDASGIITSINRRGMELLHVESDSLGTPIQGIEWIPVGELYASWWANRLGDCEQIYCREHRGILQRLQVSCQGLKDQQANEIGAVLQISDITERSLIEERFRRMERYMGLGSLAGGLHHEIKNPLAALSLHAQLLEENLVGVDAPEPSTHMLSVIRTEIARIERVLESFRDFASLGQLSPQEVDLNDLLSSQVQLLTPQLTQRGIAVEFNQRQHRYVISADRMRVEQVLINLILNAMEAMPQSGRLTLGFEEDASSVHVLITDTGSGIPESLHEKILDPYFTTKSNGTGLGLAICDKIMRQHSGSIDFKTSQSGTTFRISFPRSNQLTHAPSEVAA